MGRESTRSAGARGEDAACEYLGSCGYTVIGRNVFRSHKEIDIICEDERYIVFAEVKSRTDTPALKKYGRPASAVDMAKRRNVAFAAKDYLSEHPTDKIPRIDVIEVWFSRDGSVEKINHMKGVFGANGK